MASELNLFEMDFEDTAEAGLVASHDVKRAVASSKSYAVEMANQIDVGGKLISIQNQVLKLLEQKVTNN